MFTLQLGVRAEGFTRDQQAFPTELDLDVSVGIGQARRRAWDPHWSLSQPEKAVREITRLLNGSGERWFSRFDSVEQELESLESLAAEDTTQTWLYPLLVAMRIRAQRGEFAEAQRDLQEHLAQRRDYLATRDVAYGVLLVRAVTYGVAIPEGSEAFIHLGQAWRATRLVAVDLRTTSRIELHLSGDLDRSREIPQLRYRDATLQVGATEKAEITCEVSDFLQREISEELQSPWPMCPDHHNVLHAGQVAGDAVWYCQEFQHSVSTIGQLPRSNPNGHRS